MASSLSVTELLAPFRGDPGGTGVFTDFDGTLAPIVDDPAAAQPLPGVVDALAALADRYGRVGVISGRPASFLAEHLGGRGVFLSGLYGLEFVEDEGGGIQAIEEAAAWREIVEEVAAAGDSALPAGISVERKGLCLTVHHRRDPSLEPASREWVAAKAAETGLVVHLARMSFELRPPLKRDKGTVLAEAAAGRRQVCFLGDDRGDLTAFDTLDHMAAQGATVLRVGVDSPEAPAEILERADIVVEGPEGSLRILRGLLSPSG